MSDTPRTDKEHAKTLTLAYEYEGAEIDAWEWARKLERECDNLAKQCVKNVEEIGTLRAQLREAKKDAARFAWVLKYATRGASYIQCMGFRVNSRESIDAAMQREAANDV